LKIKLIINNDSIPVHILVIKNDFGEEIEKISKVVLSSLRFYPPILLLNGVSVSVRYSTRRDSALIERIIYIDDRYVLNNLIKTKHLPMKKSLLLTITLISCILAFSQDKKTQVGIKSGLNLAILSASINSESSYKPGFHVGMYVKTPGGFRPEIYFSSQGQKDNYVSPPSFVSTGKTTTTLNYLNIPLLMEMGKKKVTFQVGPQIGFVLSGKEKGTVNGQPVDDNLKDFLKSPDISLVLGMGLNLSEQVSLGIRYNHGLSDIFSSPEDLPPGVEFPSVKNRVFHFYLAVAFNK
jgi:hypothetical protein